MKIGELARHSGVTASAIRYYEQEGLLPHPPRVSGRRSYHPSDVARIRLIQSARSVGFTIREVRVLCAGVDRKLLRPWKQLAERKILEFDEKLAELARMRGLLKKALHCECVDLVACGKFLSADPASSSRADEFH